MTKEVCFSFKSELIPSRIKKRNSELTEKEVNTFTLKKSQKTTIHGPNRMVN
jgi:hypothetical protein